jgi:hypothetical protein
MSPALQLDFSRAFALESIIFHTVVIRKIVAHTKEAFKLDDQRTVQEASTTKNTRKSCKMLFFKANRLLLLLPGMLAIYFLSNHSLWSAFLPSDLCDYPYPFKSHGKSLPITVSDPNY